MRNRFCFAAMDLKARFLKNLEHSREVTADLKALAVPLRQAAELISDTLKNGGKILTCGNGGSAAEAMHLSSELVGRYRSDRIALPAICLNSNGADLTCIVNDYGYESVFARQVEAFGREGDVLVVFSTSGKSPNVLRALYKARSMGLNRIGFLGKDGGEAKGAAGIELIVPSSDGPRIQESHTILLHTICDYLEETMR